MSAPDTNVERQAEKHKPALFGIRAAMVFGALMLIGVVFLTALGANDDTVEGNAVDGAAGSAVELETYAPGTNASD